MHDFSILNLYITDKWLFCNWTNQLLPSWRVILLGNYKEIWEGRNGHSRPKSAIHLDQFMILHDASINEHWSCVDP